MSFNCIVITGPTASGKTRLAARLASDIGTEIISIDSRQVYRDMNIGTGKDYEDYIVNGKKVPAHLIDIVPAGGEYHINRFLKDAGNAFREISDKGMLPLLCGGTPLYLDALLKGFQYTSIPPDEALREKLGSLSREELLAYYKTLPATSYTPLADLSSSRRMIRAVEISNFLLVHVHVPIEGPLLKPLVFGMDLPKDVRWDRIHKRLQQRLPALIEEVKSLLDNGLTPIQLVKYGLEYKFTVIYLEGKLSLQEFDQQLYFAIRQFAKRQLTYFRKMEREGLHIHWINAEEDVEEQLRKVKEIMTTEKIGPPLA